MSRISWRDRLRVPDYRNTSQVAMGRVDFNHEQCRSCGLCRSACPADSIIMTDQKPRPGPAPRECIFCGDCLAICPAEAVIMVSPFRLEACFLTLDRGPVFPPRLDFESI
jgi:formate hydrogenlyase subunit 6/NADH:ubiquinone oxidoreductase subunit I